MIWSVLLRAVYSRPGRGRQSLESPCITTQIPFQENGDWPKQFGWRLDLLDVCNFIHNHSDICRYLIRSLTSHILMWRQWIRLGCRIQPRILSVSKIYTLRYIAYIFPNEFQKPKHLPKGTWLCCLNHFHSPSPSHKQIWLTGTKWKAITCFEQVLAIHCFTFTCFFSLVSIASKSKAWSPIPESIGVHV